MAGDRVGRALRLHREDVHAPGAGRDRGAADQAAAPQRGDDLFQRRHFLLKFQFYDNWPINLGGGSSDGYGTRCSRQRWRALASDSVSLASGRACPELLHRRGNFLIVHVRVDHCC